MTNPRITMKNLFPSLILVLSCFTINACHSPAKTTGDHAPDAAHSSMLSVDWKGTYTGVLPCADCEGIETVITLNEDLTYYSSETYAGKQVKPFTKKGSFSWSRDGSNITLRGNDSVVYKVGEGKLTRLDKEGKKITGVLSDKYMLTKETSGITEKYWKLTEIMGKPVPADFIKEPHMILKAGIGRFNATGGCNSIGGSYTLKDHSRISFSNAISTQMACPNMKTESQFLKVLEMADSYFYRNDTLVLNRARMAPLARFVTVWLY